MRQRNPVLDFLRFIGIALTLFAHLEITGHSLPEQCAAIIRRGGWVGVDLFFVLSGFLVSGLIFSELDIHEGFSPGAFLIRRAFKIYPAYYLFLAITWGMTLWFHYASPGSNFKYLAESFFFCNYLPGSPIHSWFWSICVEEHFYLFLCIFIVLLIRFNRLSLRSFISIYLVFLVLGLGLRTYNALHYPDFNFFRDCARSHLRFDSLFFGVVLSYMNAKDVLPRMRSTVLPVLALAGVALPFIFDINTHRFIPVLSLAINPLCFGYLMLRMLQVEPSGIRLFATIGKYSYSIYLFHGFVNLQAIQHFSGWKYYIVYLFGSLIVGILVSKMVEYPFLALRDRFFPGTRSIPGLLPAAAGTLEEPSGVEEQPSAVERYESVSA